MARIKYSVGVDEITGSVGGVTFQSNFSGFIIRSKPQIRKHRTIIQSNQLIEFTKLSQLWRSLSSDDKEEWNNFSWPVNYPDLWEVPKTRTGSQWFMLCNARQLLTNDTYYTVPNTNFISVSTPVFTVTINATEILINSASTIGAGNDQFVIFATSPLLTSTPTPRRLFRYLTHYPGDTVLPIDIASEWENVFGMNVDTHLYTPGNQIVVAISKAHNDSFIPVYFGFGRS